MYYLIFASQQSAHRDVKTDRHELQWYAFGVYEADTADAACKAAASDSRQLGTFCAVECHPWGVDMLDTGNAKRLGVGASLEDTIARAQHVLDRLTGD